MTARDLEVLLRQSPDLDELWQEVLHHSNQDGSASLSVFSRDELQAYVGYLCNAIESAPEVPLDSVLTKEVALSLHHRQELFHKKERDSRGRPVKARVNGKVKTWKKQPDDFEIPMKHGLKDTFTISTANRNMWCDPNRWALTEEEATQRNVSAKDVVSKWERVNPFSTVLSNVERIVVVALEDLRIVVRWKHSAQEVSFEATTAMNFGNNVWSLSALDAWRSNGAWIERGVSELERVRALEHTENRKYEGHTWFQYVGEPAPWKLAHNPSCPLSRAGDLYFAASRTCACGLFGEAPRMNPVQRERRALSTIARAMRASRRS